MKLIDISLPDDWKTLEAHELADCFPMMTEQELNSLVVSIRKGYHQDKPVVLFDGKVLDGRNRQKATAEAGGWPAFAEFEGTWEEARDWCVATNRDRRNLTPGQLSLVAGRLANLKRGSNRHGRNVEGSADPSTSNPNQPAVSVEEAAEKLGIGRETAKRGKAVIDKGAPEVIEAVETRKIGSEVAAKIVRENPVIKTAPKEKQEEAAKKQVAAVAAATAPKPKQPKSTPVGPSPEEIKEKERQAAIKKAMADHEAAKAALQTEEARKVSAANFAYQTLSSSFRYIKECRDIDLLYKIADEVQATIARLKGETDVVV